MPWVQQDDNLRNYGVDAAVSKALTDPASEAGMALKAAYVPKWKPSTAYAAGEPVVNPSGQLVTANTAFTSGTTYSAANWTVTAGGTGGGGTATTDASQLTTGTLAPARIADGTLPIAKLAVDIATQAELDAASTADRARANHTGTQAASTITGLAAVATTGAYGDLSGKPTVPATAADVGAVPTAGQIAAALDGTGNYRGAVTLGTAYAVGDVVLAEGGLFRANTANTTNASGFRYGRNYWDTVQTPVLGASTTVPVRQLDLTQPGVGSTNPPRAGMFQRRPKQFNYRSEKVLWAFQAAADLTKTGTLSTVTTGTQVGGSVVLTAGASNDGYATAAALTTPVDLTGGHLRFPVKLSAAANRSVTLQFTSAGTDYTNSSFIDVVMGNIDGFRTGQWTTIGVPVSEIATQTGTGANLAAVNGVRINLYGGGTFTCEVARLSWHPNTADKAKVILWLDDGTWTSHLTAIKTAAKYGFPVTLAPIADNLVNAGAAINADAARYVQNVLGGQVAVHAFGSTDHNSPLTGSAAFEELLDYQHFGLAMGLHGVEDVAYWSTGYTGPGTDAEELTVRKLFRSGRGGTSRLPETLPPGQPTLTRAYMTSGTDTSAAQWQPYVTKAIACKGLAQFVWHDMTGTPLTEFATFCAWLDTQRANVQVTTPQGAFDPLCL